MAACKLLGSLGLIVFLELATLASKILFEKAFYIAPAVIIIIFTILTPFLYICSRLYALSVVAFFYTAYFILQFIWTGLAQFIDSAQLSFDPWLYHLQWLSTLLLLTSLYFVLKRFRIPSEALSSKYSLYLSLMLSCFLFSMSLLLNTIGNSLSADALTPIFILGFIIILFILISFVLSLRYMSLKNQEENYKLIVVSNLKLSEYNNELQGVYLNNSRLLHDIKNHLVTIGSAIKAQNFVAAEEYIEELCVSFSSYAPLIDTGNELINAILNTKLSYAVQHDIRFDANVDFPLHTSIKDTDLCSILGNLLDNAFDASIPLLKEERNISLLILSKNNFLIIKVENTTKENPFVANPQLATNKPSTTKEPHGLGLLSVKKTIANYDGGIGFDYKDKKFSVVVTMCFADAKL